MAPTGWAFRDGKRLTPAMLYDFLGLDEEFYRITGERLKISDGIRTDEEQERVFRDRYRIQASGNGPFNDVRWWQGQRWVRVKDGGTVAAPGSSNHQINLSAGRRGALDIYDTGRDAGVLTRGSWRANVFDQIAPRYGYDSEGYAFGETWHKRYNRDPWRAVPASSGSPQPLPIPNPPRVPEEVLTMANTEVIVTERDNSKPPRPIGDEDRRLAFVNTDSGYTSIQTWVSLGDADRFAKQVGMKDGALRFTDAGFDAYLAGLAEIRAAKG